jgi:hypothetical protein
MNLIFLEPSLPITLYENYPMTHFRAMATIWETGLYSCEVVMKNRSIFMEFTGIPLTMKFSDN